MPAKSRRKRGKNTPPAKRKKDQKINPSAAVQQQAVVQNAEPVSAPDVPAVSRSTPASAARTKTASYPHIAAELWTIGILAVIMLVILIVLAAVL